MTQLLDIEPKSVSSTDSEQNTASSSNLVQPISFRQHLRNSGRSLKIQKRDLHYSWNRVLTQTQTRSAKAATPSAPGKPQERKTVERREFPRHSSEAIVLAFTKDERNFSEDSDCPESKGYAINVSQNGISFASRSQFPLRDELQLHVEDHHVNFGLDLMASVVRAEPIDDELWRIDCKLLIPLTEQQLEILKEHAPSCYAG
ncbi:PilZ domain-containing protein [Gimesia aquarii]|uniref:PilZ domain protein n=1 Tax=Gimesia aquarii TaxID=2527964 RepID=A0A517WP11_9PLAN|nr:PilZ domain-containing protein [Gimesia aquarii]QDU07001.1 PilZ domain protein [Gimesia aquarii]